MLTIHPTPTGIGVELLTSLDVMHQLYELAYALMDNNNDGDDPTNHVELMLLSFAYEMRHSIMDAEFLAQQAKMVPCSIKLIWPDMITYLMCMRKKAAYVPLSSTQLEQLKQLEDALIGAMYEYDPQSAENNKQLVQPLFDFDNGHLMFVQHLLHNEYINTKPRKKAFKLLTAMMYSFHDYLGLEHRKIELELKSNAKKYNCEIKDLRMNEEYLEVKRW